MKFLSAFCALVAVAVLHVQAKPTQAEVQEKAAQGLRLISLGPDVDPVWKTEDEVLELIENDTRFMDKTETYQEDQVSAQEVQRQIFAYPTPSHQTEVKALIANLSVTNLQTTLGNLTAFNNRYYRVQTGEDATQWIIKTLQSIITAYPTSGASVARYAHSFTQGSVIAKIPGTGSSSDITIVGGHLDSINQNSPTSGRAPGADDDGSAVANLIEAFRVLLVSGFKPSSPVEFHFYAGEEGGLLGSQAIASSYSSAKKSVKAMLQLDMTAYTKPGNTEVIALMPDYVDSTLNTFLKAIISAYNSIPSASSSACGYACSDHASWYELGYPTCLPHEAPYGQDSQVLHTTGDTTTATGFSFTHMHEFSKLLVGFVYELAV